MQFKAIAHHGKIKLMGALLRPEGEFLEIGEKAMPEKVQAVYNAAREAGKQVVKDGQISDETQKEVAQELLTIDQFIQGANAYFKSLMEQTTGKGA